MIDYIDTIRTTLKKRRKDNKIMASKVYFADLRADYHENLQQKLTRLLKTAGPICGPTGPRPWRTS